MEEIKLNDALKNCSKSCGWCTHQCPDEDKYEMLVYCIQIQKEFLAIGKLLREIIGEKYVKVVKDIGTLFELIIYDLHKKKLIVDKEYPEVERKLPGCSQIFFLSQSIQQTIWNKSTNHD